MGSWYRLEITAFLPTRTGEYVPKTIQEIDHALDTESFDFEPSTFWVDSTKKPPIAHVQLKSDFKLSGAVEEYIDHVCQTIWKAYGAYCKLSVQWLYLEELPWETSPKNEEDYARLVGEDDAAPR